MWRKSYAWKNIFGDNGGGGSKRKLLPDERSVWDDYLDMAALSPIKGQVCINSTTGYTLEQLCNIFHTPVATIARANKKMQELGMITVENNGIVVINNWKLYQSDYERVKVYKDTPKDTKKDTSKDTPIDIDNRNRKRIKKYIRKEYKDIYIYLFNHWNSKKIIVHKYITDSLYGVINHKLDVGYTKEEIAQAIDNYNTILKGKQYFWSYEWTLEEFLRRGLDKFMDLERAKRNYADKYRQAFEEEIAEDIKRIKSKSADKKTK